MRALLRVLGVATMAGGALRIADGFASRFLSPDALAALYFTTDVFLLLGIAGIYLSRRATLGSAGRLGAAVFAIAIVLVRVTAFGWLGANGYELGATIALLGLALLSSETILRRNGSYISASLWLAALILGVAGAVGAMPAAMMLLAGVTFGVGFVAAGLEIFAA